MEHDALARRRAVAVAAGVGAAFVCAHAWHALSWASSVSARQPGALGQSRGTIALFAAVHSGVVFVAFTAVSVAFGRRFGARRGLWAVPVAVFVASSLPAALALGDGRAPLRPLLELAGMSRPWLFACAQMAAVLLAAWPVVRAKPARTGEVPLMWPVVAALAGFGAVLAVMRAYGEGTADPAGIPVDGTLALLFAAGVAMGVRRPWFPAAHVFLGWALSPGVFMVLDWMVPSGFFVLPAGERVRLLGAGVMPGLFAVLLGSLAEPISRMIRARRHARPVASADPA